MVKVEEMNPKEMRALLHRVDYGHLACARDNRPYIVPIHYVYAEPNIYIYTTEGEKTAIIDVNPEVCLQVEEVQNTRDWRSVIVNGRTTHVTTAEDRMLALTYIKEHSPAQTPAIHERWTTVWASDKVSAIYRLHPDFMSGRSTVSY